VRRARHRWRRRVLGGNDAQLDCIGVFSHKASGGKYVPRAVLFGLEPGVIGAVRASPLGRALPPGQPRERKRGCGQQLGRGPLRMG
jgi:tubulin beta